MVNKITQVPRLSGHSYSGSSPSSGVPHFPAPQEACSAPESHLPGAACAVPQPVTRKSSGASRPSWRDHGKLIGSVGAGTNGPILQPRKLRPRERACAHSLFSVSQPPSLPLTCVPLPQLLCSPPAPPAAPKLLSFWALHRKPPELRGRATSWACDQGSRTASEGPAPGSMLSSYPLQMLNTFCIRSLHVHDAPAPTRDVADSLRGVNLLGGVTLGLGCCVHAPILLLLLIHLVVATMHLSLWPDSHPFYR